MKALGMIEVYGYLAAVEALDSAVKAANVSLVEVKKVKGGLVAVMVTGDVGATKAAIHAAAAAAARVGKVISAHVIPRPAPGIEKIVGQKKAAPRPVHTVAEDVPTARQTEKPKAPEDDNISSVGSKEEALGKMTVADLRREARELEVKSMTKQEIRFAKKDALIRAILEHSGQER